MIVGTKCIFILLLEHYYLLFTTKSVLFCRKLFDPNHLQSILLPPVVLDQAHYNEIL